MPGVLRMTPAGQPAGGGPPNQLRPPGQGGQGGGPPPPSPRQASPSQPPKSGGGSKPPPPKADHAPKGAFVADNTMPLEDKVAKLEKHLEALYQLPSNQDLLEKAQLGNSMSVNDMWQIIQLNNRIAAAEAAIQKMASLIEDLAKNMGRVKSDTKGLKKGTAELTTTSSNLALQGDDLTDRCEKCEDVIKDIRADIEKLKKGVRI